MHVQCMYYTCAIHVLYMCYTRAMNVLYMYYTCAITCYACAIACLTCSLRGRPYNLRTKSSFTCSSTSVDQHYSDCTERRSLALQELIKRPFSTVESLACVRTRLLDLLSRVARRKFIELCLRTLNHV